MNEIELAYYRLDQSQKRKTVREAIKQWRDKHPEHSPSRPIHHSWYGWVMWSTNGEAGAVADVMKDCVIPYLKRSEAEEFQI